MSHSKARVSGAVAVEFALLIIPLLLIVAGIVEFGRMFWYYDAISKGTRDAARYVSNARASSTQAVDNAISDWAIDMVVASATAANVPDFEPGQVSVTCDPADCSAPDYVSVSVAYPLQLGSWIPFFGSAGATTWDVTLAPATTMRYMR